MESYRAIGDFLDAHDIQNDEFGNCDFKAVVEFKSQARSGTGITNVKIIRNGYDDGLIKLDDTKEFPVKHFHLDFSPTFQSYSFSEADSKLVISGKSPKMAGSYTVTIYPLS
jgi:hypothetical protein